MLPDAKSFGTGEDARATSNAGAIPDVGRSKCQTLPTQPPDAGPMTAGRRGAMMWRSATRFRSLNYRPFVPAGQYPCHVAVVGMAV